jgi:hypothetical protein
MQYQVRTGPIQNDAAVFSLAMTQGSAPHRSRASQGPRIGLPSFVDVPSFAFESILASRLDGRNHLTKAYQAQPIPYPHLAAGFSPEMAAGAQGQTWPSPRILLGPKIPLPTAQPTHVSAPLDQPMVQGYIPRKPRISAGRQIGLPVSVLGIDFQFESIFASQLDARNHLTKPQHWNALFQSTHTDAPFQSVMVDGVTAPRARILRPLDIGLPQWAFVQAFSFDSVLASQIDQKARLTRPQHLQPFSQLTHTPAPFSMEMVSQVLDLRSRQTKPRQSSEPDLIFVGAFPFDSVLASCLDTRSRLSRGIQTGHQGIRLVDGFLQFDSILASRMDSRSHLARVQQSGLFILPQVVDFPFESILGSRVDNRNHLRNPLHLAPISQTSPTAAAFSPEMFRGWVSIPAQLKNTGLFLFYATTGEDLGVANLIGVVGPINNPAAVSGSASLGAGDASDILGIGSDSPRHEAGSVSPKRGIIPGSVIRRVKKTP